MKFGYRKNEISTLSLFDHQVNVAIGQEIIWTLYQGFFPRIGSHVRYQNAFVNVDKDQSYETPRPRHEPDLESIGSINGETTTCIRSLE